MSGRIVQLYNGHVRYGQHVIELLPKEYALFEFLWHHPNQVFTRPQLLNAIWNQENPVDRTVDDHVYRIRRKLAILSTTVSIDTVHRRGYRLRVKSNNDQANKALLDNPLLQHHVNGLLEQYILYGSGDGIEMLSSHSECFGTPKDPKALCRLHYLTGNFKKIVTDESIPFRTRAFLLNGLTTFATCSDSDRLDIALCLLDKQVLLPSEDAEIQCFDLPHLYARTGQHELAWNWHNHAIKIVEDEQYLGFRPGVHISGAKFLMFQGRLTSAYNLLVKADSELSTFRWMREQAAAELVRGFLSFSRNESKHIGFSFLEHSFQMAELTKIPHVQAEIVHEIVCFLRSRREPIPPIWYERWANLDERFDLERNGLLAYKQLKTILYSSDNSLTSL